MKLEMKNMATNVSQSKVAQQQFKCFNCGRKTVSLGNNIIVTEKELKNGENDDFDKESVLSLLKLLNDEWLASCTYCGWTDS